MVNILVIDTYSIFRYGLKSVLEKEAEFRVIGDAASTSEALAELGELQPDVVIMDIYTPNSEGVKAITLLQEKFPNVKVLIFTISDKEEDFFQAMRAGARGYLLKSVGTTEVIESVRLMASGDAVVSPLMAFKSLNEFRNTNKHNPDKVNCLSPRETEVLRLVAQGASNKEIAAHCYVSETTTKAHVRRILEKLNVRNRAQAAALAISKGLLNQP